MKHRHVYLTALLITLWAAFIVGNSLLSGQQSGNLSKSVLQWLQRVFPFLKFMTQHLLRKMAHVTEFAILGFLAAAFFRILGERKLHAISSPLLLGMIVAALDETVQSFVPGRGSSVIDVWIDTAGAFCGIVALLLLWKLVSSLYRRSR